MNLSDNSRSEAGPGVAEIRRRLDALGLRIAAALNAAVGEAGPRGSQISVLAVTKGFAPGLLRDAHSAGVRQIGENYAQELLSKAEVIRSLSDCEVHFIGQLQTNKVRSLVGLVDRFDSVDRPSLVTELAQRAPGTRILIQVNTSGDPRKGGCLPSEVPALCDLARGRGLLVEGLMTVGPTHGGAEAARSGFALVRSIADELGLKECSMGMSEDLEVAIAEGATQIRVGRALFGARA
jgi:PLP dependent protein